MFHFDEREIAVVLFSLLGLIELSPFRGHKDCGSDLFSFSLSDERAEPPEAK